jgi:hypothetical protein
MKSFLFYKGLDLGLPKSDLAPGFILTSKKAGPSLISLNSFNTDLSSSSVLATKVCLYPHPFAMRPKSKLAEQVGCAPTES